MLTTMLIVSCSDTTNSIEEPSQIEENSLKSSDRYSSEKPGYQEIISKALVKGQECDEYVSGIVEYRLNGELLATIDYGKGECDGVAVKITDGKSHTFSLVSKDSKWDYEKAVTKKLIKGKDCNEYVSGIIEYRQAGKIIASVDYGNGECDGVASKIADGESHTFNLTKENK